MFNIAEVEKEEESVREKKLRAWWKRKLKAKLFKLLIIFLTLTCVIMCFYFINGLWKVKKEKVVFMKTLLSSLVFDNAC